MTMQLAAALQQFGAAFIVPIAIALGLSVAAFVLGIFAIVRAEREDK